jgi:hypothetical protein
MDKLTMGQGGGQTSEEQIQSEIAGENTLVKLDF